jgi:hypothetical protein
MDAIDQRYRVVVSTETLIEMMDMLKGGNGEFFESDRKRIRLMAGTDVPVFLSSVGEYSLRTSLGIERPAKFQPVEFERWYEVITSATTRIQLFNEGVQWRKGRFIVNPDIIVEQQRAGKSSYRKWLKRYVTGRYTFPQQEQWALNHARQLGCELTPDEALKLGTDMSAAYEFSKRNFAVASAEGAFRENSRTREGDWVDGQQLMYLCDPTMHFLTGDRRIKSKCSASWQCGRILLLSSFVSDLGIQISDTTSEDSTSDSYLGAGGAEV